MSTFSAIKQDLIDARNTRGQLAKQLYQVREDLSTMDPKIKSIKRKDESIVNIEQTKAALEAQVITLKGQLTQADADIVTLEEALFQIGTPQELIEEWNDDIPILLFPVKAQYRFQERSIKKIIPLPQPVPIGIKGKTPAPKFITETIVKKELWVRIFPDDIHIDSHETELTEEEYNAGVDYWSEVWDAPADIMAHKGKWRLLSRQFEPSRAAWICKQTKPTNWPPSIPPGPTPIPPPPTPPAVYPNYDFKQMAWSQAPKSLVMPDKFVIRAYRGGSYKEEIGNTIPFPLIVGPDPQQADTSFEEVNGVLQVDPEMEWMVNFEKAIASGMGIRMELTDAEFKDGFDQLFVLGLKHSADSNEGSELVEGLIDAHHYAPGSGMSIAPQDTPTNNTKEASSGFINRIRDEDFTFKTELQDPLFDPTTINGNWNFTRSDGQLLAEALGIQYEPLQHIAYADQQEIGWSRAMNHLLYPGTLGYYQEQMLTPLFENTDPDQFRDFFMQHVMGRGNLPVFRIDNQPYGIITTSAFSKMVWNTGTMDQVAQSIQDILEPLHGLWASLIPGIKTVRNTSADWQTQLMEILNLHGGTVEMHQRFAWGPELMWNIMNWYQSQNVGSWGQDIQAQAQSIMNALSFLTEEPRVLYLNHIGAQTKLTGQLCDPLPLSDTDPLSFNYINWLKGSSPQKIYDEDFGADPAPSELLYLMLRNAYLQEHHDSAIKIWKALGYDVDRLEKEMLHFGKTKEGVSVCDDTRWGVLSTEFPNKSISMGEMLFDPNTFGVFPNQTRYLSAYKQTLSLMSEVPSAQLERTFLDHIDLCTYRMDAYQLGLANYRLEQLRHASDPTNRSTGVYIGSFGWLEDVRPGPARNIVPDSDVPQAFEDTTALPLTYELGNAGSIHAHSVTQAVTGAVLRENYLAHGGARMNVNISSERVRQAKKLIEGIQNGQELGALLGYEFERALHEGYPGVEMDQYLFPLRVKFPLNTMEETPSGDNVPSESRNVLHGLNFLKATRTGNYPYGLGSVLPTSVAVRDAIINEVQKLESIVDAIADLTTAEGVHQGVLGNYERSSAILNAPGEGKLIPDPEVVATPRSVIALTQKVGILWDAAGTATWHNSTSSPRALAEPALNHWLVGILGDPSNIKCKVQYIIDEGTINEVIQDIEITVRDLLLEPIDLVILGNTDLTDNASELSARIAWHVRRTLQLDDDITIKIDYKNRVGWASQERSIYEIRLLLVYLLKMINEGRAIHAGDFLIGNEEAEFAEPLENYDLAELRTRVRSAYDGLANPGTGLIAVIENQIIAAAAVDPIADPIGARTTLDLLREQLISAANLGIPTAFPISSFEVSVAAQETLVLQAKASIKELKARVAKATTSWTDIVGGNGGEMVEIEQAAKDMFGDSFRIFPKFTLHNQAEINLAYSASSSILQDHPPLIMEEWRSGVSNVREKVKQYSMVAFQSEMLNNVVATNPPQDFGLTPLQLPFDADPSVRWLGLEVPETQIIENDTLSIVVNLHDGFDSSQNIPRSGLLLDEWVEEIPSNVETTGIAYNYHEPQIEPPQALLLAVTPEVTGAWNWEDLMSTLVETLDLSKKRGVSPEQLGNTKLAQLIPGIIAPIANRKGETITTDFRKNNQ